MSEIYATTTEEDAEIIINQETGLSNDRKNNVQVILKEPSSMNKRWKKNVGNTVYLIFLLYFTSDDIRMT